MAFVSWQIDLRPREDNALQQGENRWPEMQGEIVRLIEAAAVLPPRMKRDRHHAIGIAEQLDATFTHQRTEARRNRSPAIVLQCVNDVLHPPLIFAHRTRPADGMRGVEADLERRQAPNAGPAHLAHRPVQRMTQALAAGRARRLEER
jgi:hypothetical protein